MDITFVWRKDIVNADGTSLIYLHTTVSDGRVRLSTGIRSAKKFSSRVNVLLNDIRAKLEDLEYNFKRQGKKITKREVEACVKGPVASKSDTFFEYWDQWIEESRTRISDITGKLIAPATISRYKTVKKTLEQFETDTRYQITIEDFGNEFFAKFQKYVLGKLQYDINTFSDYVKNIKAFCTWLQRKDSRLSNEFRDFKKSFSYSDAKPFKREELLKIYDKEMIGYKERARLILLFLCSTGMRISDYNTFTDDEIFEQMIVHTSKKTNAEFYVPFYDDMYFRPVGILEQMKAKFGSIPRFKDRSRLNKQIQSVVKECGIERIVPTTKTGRKTFVTLKLLDGVAPEIIMKSTGHRTRAAFDRYAGIDTSDILKAYKDKAVNFKAS